MELVVPKWHSRGRQLMSIFKKNCSSLVPTFAQNVETPNFFLFKGLSGTKFRNLFWSLQFNFDLSDQKAKNDLSFGLLSEPGLSHKLPTSAEKQAGPPTVLIFDRLGHFLQNNMFF